MADRSCEVCGAPLAGRQRRFCCKAHARRIHKQEAKARGAAWATQQGKPTLVALTCGHCAKSYEGRKPKADGEHRFTYCSPECQAEAKAWRYRTIFSLPIPWSGCIDCGGRYVAKRGRLRCDACHSAPSVVPWLMGWCRRCGEAFMVGPGGGRAFTRYCCQSCKQADTNERHEARKRAAHVEDVWRSKVFERDNWTCQLCNEPVDRESKAPDPWSASLDHIVPLAQGGKHSYDNVQLAHFWCNTVKGDSPDRAALLLA